MAAKRPKPTKHHKLRENSCTADTTIESWLHAAREGDRSAHDRLHRWAYAEALEYFGQKVRSEPLLGEDDVGELVGRFYTDFESTWVRARSITHYARRMLKNTTARYIALRRRRQRRFVSEFPADLAVDETPTPWRRWTDKEFNQYRAIVRTFYDSDEVTRTVVSGRLADPPRSYRDLAEELDVQETALRMRLSRFYRQVRYNFQCRGESGMRTKCMSAGTVQARANLEMSPFPWTEL